MFEGCEFGGDGSQWTTIIPIIILVVLMTVMRRRRPSEKTPQDIASSLLLDVMANQKILEEFNLQKRPKKLKSGSWQRNHEKLDFLDASLRNNLSSFFKQAEDCNMMIESSKMFKSTSYLSGINVDRLKEPLNKGREGLEEWLKANLPQTGPGAGRPGCLGGGFGGGS